MVSAAQTALYKNSCNVNNDMKRNMYFQFSVFLYMSCIFNVAFYYFQYIYNKHMLEEDNEDRFACKFDFYTRRSTVMHIVCKAAENNIL